MNRYSAEHHHSIEQNFHDAWAETIDLDDLLVRESFENATAVENRHALGEFGSLQGKRILDLGCGAGETSVYFALQGAEVSAVDISPKMIDVGKRLADRHSVKVDWRVMKAEELAFGDGSFDFVFGNGVLHHVILEPALREVQRVLRPGGTAVFIEPLGYNPVIEVYRHLAKTVRTETEKPFTFKSLPVFRKYFPSVRHKEFWLFTLSIFIYFFLIERSNPSKDRYWKKVVRDSSKYEGVFRVLFKIDEVVLSILPFLGRLCWNTVLVLKR
jgi:2-polyprenyl-3-methyl-5-hydroxy-6-metoxy-1,4-benzoquinol methylase